MQGTDTPVESDVTRQLLDFHLNPFHNQVCRLGLLLSICADHIKTSAKSQMLPVTVDKPMTPPARQKGTMGA